MAKDFNGSGNEGERHLVQDDRKGHRALHGQGEWLSEDWIRQGGMSWNAVPLGQELSFSSLLNGQLTDDMRRRFLRFNARSALDLGCGTGDSLLMLYYALGVDILEGVDNRWESWIADDAIEALELEGVAFSERTLAGYWATYISEPSDAREQITDLARLASLMDISFATNLVGYQPKRSSYDIVLLSHVLHYLASETIRSTLEMVDRHTHANSLIYYSVKDAPAAAACPPEQMLEVCRNFATRRGLTEYSGDTMSGEGRCYTFTNL